MLNRIEIPLDRDYSDYPISLGNATHMWIEQCDSYNAYIKIDDVTSPRMKIKEDMRLEFKIPVQRIYLSVNRETIESKIVFLVYSDMKIHL